MSHQFPTNKDKLIGAPSTPPPPSTRINPAPPGEIYLFTCWGHSFEPRPTRGIYVHMLRPWFWTQPRQGEIYLFICWGHSFEPSPTRGKYTCSHDEAIVLNPALIGGNILVHMLRPLFWTGCCVPFRTCSTKTLGSGPPFPCEPGVICVWVCVQCVYIT